MATRLTARVRRHVVDVDLALDLTAAPITVLFGPSGAGKTTLLRCIAGLDRPDDGSVVALDDETWDAPGTHVPARRRRVGYLFQDHALFPHLDVAGNVAYGLHGVRRGERPARVRTALAQAGADHLVDRPTRQLSGGEAQRVALARALAPRPGLLLLDEPLSALDAPTRARVRRDLRAQLVGIGVPSLIVTHDRSEALALGDRIVVLIDGRVRQVGPVTEVFSRPADPDVAAAVEVESVLPGRVVAAGQDLTTVEVHGVRLTAVTRVPLVSGASVLVCVRAEEVALQPPGERHDDSPRNHLPATVTDVTDSGPLLRVDLDAGFPLAAYVTRPTRDDLDLRPGREVVAAVKAPAVHLVPHAS